MPTPSDTGLAVRVRVAGLVPELGLTCSQLPELMVEAVGPYAQPFDPAYLECEHEHAVTGYDDAAPLAAYYFNYRKTSIYGGSNEIQRNIISQMILGL